MHLFLEAADTFFFRDGRPFSRGEQTEGYSINMPFPSTVMGALRTTYIASYGGLESFEGGNMQPVIGTRATLDGASVQLKGVFMGNARGEIFFSIPRDLVMEKHAQDSRLHALKLETSPDFVSNAQLPALLTSDPGKQVEYRSGFMPRGVLGHYLQEEMSGLHAETESLLVDEPKVGIARSRYTLAAEESMLYRLHMKRFRDREHGFVVEVEGLAPFPERGMLKLGGENKSFQYETLVAPSELLTPEAIAKMEDAINQRGLFKLYLATPAIYDEGWRPGWVGEDGHGELLTASGDTLSLQLIAAAIGNYVNVGGWDVAQRRAKDMYRAVPAGTVYYYRLLDGTRAQAVVEYFHNRNRSDQRQQEGFGLGYVGVVSASP